MVFYFMEIWKDVKGYEGLYQVSDLGNVKSLKKTVINKNNKPQFYSEKILKPNKRRNGYLGVALCKANKIKGLSIHRLVAIAFLDNKEQKKCVNHIDSKRDNNLLSNLEWCTHSENRLHGIEKGNVLKKSVYSLSETGEKTFYISIGHAVKEGYSRASISNRVNGKIENTFYKGCKWYFKPNLKKVLYECLEG